MACTLLQCQMMSGATLTNNYDKSQKALPPKKMVSLHISHSTHTYARRCSQLACGNLTFCRFADEYAVTDKEYYKIPFLEALELVKTRAVFLKGGYAYVPRNKMVSILHGRFRTYVRFPTFFIFLLIPTPVFPFFLFESHHTMTRHSVYPLRLLRSAILTLCAAVECESHPCQPVPAGSPPRRALKAHAYKHEQGVHGA
jgi:hypothetical protein